MKRSIAVLFALAAASSVLAADSPADKAKKALKQMEHKDSQVRAQAALQLGVLDVPEALPALTAALQDYSVAVRLAVLRSLDYMKERARPAIPALRDLLADSDPTVRFNTVVILRGLDAASVTEMSVPLAAILADPDPDADALRKPALEMLLHLGLQEAEVRQAIMGGLELGPTPVRRQMATALSDAELSLRHGPWVLDMVPALARVSQNDPDKAVRRSIAFVLGRLSPYPPPVADALLRVLDDASGEVAGTAAGSLNAAQSVPLRHQAAAQLMKRLKTGTTVESKLAAALALESMAGLRETLGPTMAAAMATEPDPRVRRAVAAALGEMGGTESIDPLLKMLKTDTDVSVRAYACAALGSYRPQNLRASGKMEAVTAALRAAVAQNPGDAQADAAEAALAAITK
ncbi:MAG: HEAT repeat domain-containing protein [Vicinamibacteria bacterium]